MKCTNCGKHFKDGNTNGLPNGIAFQLADGKTITLCQACIIKLGEMDYADKNKFINSLGVKRH